MSRLLLVNPPSDVYAKAKIAAGMTYVPQVSLAMLAAVGEREGYEVRVLDLCVSHDPTVEFREVIESFTPTVLGVTVMTPHYAAACDLVRQAKAICPDVLAVAGGAHPSTLPVEMVSDSPFDVAVFGEGEHTLAELLQRPHDLASIQGIAYKQDGTPKQNSPREPILDLDSLPLPAWHLFDLSRYPTSRMTSRRPPVGAIGTSRGCPHRCIYCSKDIFGPKVRFKSTQRVMEEIEHAQNAGIRELHVWDDHFATKPARAKEICQAIIDRGLQMPMNMFAGMRVDSVDPHLMLLLKQAGCYSVALAPETGSAELLKVIKKGITLDDCRKAFRYAREAGLETIAFFMLALPGETPETAEETIRFAIELSPDYAKVCFATPLPGTELFRMLDAEKRIKTYDWSKYAFHNVFEVYDHPTMSWDELQRCYRQFYNRFYLRPGYILPRAMRGLLNGRIVFDAYYAIRTWFHG